MDCIALLKLNISMQFYTIISFLITTLCLQVYTLPFMEPHKKGWLDRCDLLRLQNENVELTTRNPKTTKKPTHEPGGGSGGSGFWWLVNKTWDFRPKAPTEEIMETMRDKAIYDARRRGGSDAEEGDWSKDTRGFISEFYDDYDDDSHFHDDQNGNMKKNDNAVRSREMIYE